MRAETTKSKLEMLSAIIWMWHEDGCSRGRICYIPPSFSESQSSPPNGHQRHLPLPSLLCTQSPVPGQNGLSTKRPMPASPAAPPSSRILDAVEENAMLKARYAAAGFFIPQLRLSTKIFPSQSQPNSRSSQPSNGQSNMPRCSNALGCRSSIITYHSCTRKQHRHNSVKYYIFVFFLDHSFISSPTGPCGLAAVKHAVNVLVFANGNILFQGEIERLIAIACSIS